MKTREKNKEKTFIDTDSLNAAMKLKRKYNTKSQKMKELVGQGATAAKYEKKLSQQLLPLNIIEECAPDC